MSKENYGAHVSHCCYIHGCKYGDKDCPVQSGEVAQKYICYDCEEECEPYTIEEIELLRKTKSYRPTYKQLKDKVADLEAKLVQARENLTQCEADRKFEQEKKDIAMKRVSELKQQLAESEEERDGNYENYSICWKENNELKQQLAEKEKEFNWLHEKFAKYREYRHQDKILFAVEQLNQVKGKIQHNILFIHCDDYLNVIEEIDNQIKEIKGR